jgi:ribonucleoside-diphosphate reductase alpha chain
MASFEKFQSDNKKNTHQRGVYNPEFNPSISALGVQEEKSFNKHLLNYYRFVSWARWYPDLFLDLIKPETGGIILDLDQRVFLRCLLRFHSVYGVFSRGYSKTYIQEMAMYLISMFYAGIELALTAQTKQNAAELLKAKYYEITKHFPILKNEIYGNPKFSKDDAELNFVNGSRMDILANSPSSKGQRRHRINEEESALVDKVTFDDSIAPIVEVPRYTCGKLSIVDPLELNGSISYFTTAGFRGTSEHDRTLEMLDNTFNLKGEIVLGSSWLLPCWYERGSSKSKILDKRDKMSSVSFAQNYESEWVGNIDGALVSINKVLKLRNLLEAELKFEKGYDYILGIDVARSQSKNNNQTSVAVIKIYRNTNGKIIGLYLVNLYTIPNDLSFTAQAVEIKKIKRTFNAKVVICDSNGLGVGLVDALMQETFDPNNSKDNLGCWDTINTEAQPEIRSAEKCIYDLKPQSAQNEVIVNFISIVDSEILRLLEKRNDLYDIENKNNYVENVLPFLHTDFLVEEIANLQLVTLKTGKVTIEKTNSKYDKDRFSAVAYACWYAMVYENRDNGVNFNWNDFCHF